MRDTHFTLMALRTKDQTCNKRCFHFSYCLEGFRNCESEPYGDQNVISHKSQYRPWVPWHVPAHTQPHRDCTPSAPPRLQTWNGRSVWSSCQICGDLSQQQWKPGEHPSSLGDFATVIPGPSCALSPSMISLLQISVRP